MNLSIESELGRRNARIVIGLVFLLIVMTQMIDNAFNVNTPYLLELFQVPNSAAGWLPSVGGIGLAVGFLLFSSLSDRLDLRKLLAVGIVLLALPALISLLPSPSYEFLLVARFVQAFGGISLAALYLVFITRFLPESEQVIWMGLSTTAFSVGTLLGTSLGSVTHQLGWKLLFIIPLLALIVLPLLLKLLPKGAAAGQQLPYSYYNGFELLAMIVIFLNFLISNPSWSLFIMLVLALLGYLIYSRRAQLTFIPTDFFSNTRYLVTLLATFCIYLAQVAMVFVTPFIIQSLYPAQSQLSTTIFIIPYLVGGGMAAISGLIINKIGLSQSVVLGILSICLGFMLGIFFIPQAVWGLILTLSLMTTGYSFLFTPLLQEAIHHLSEDEVGTGIGLFNFVVRTSNALGISLAAFVLNSQWHLLGIWIQQPSVMIPFSNVLLVLILTLLLGLGIYRSLRRAH